MNQWDPWQSGFQAIRQIQHHSKLQRGHVMWLHPPRQYLCKTFLMPCKWSTNKINRGVWVLRCPGWGKEGSFLTTFLCVCPTSGALLADPFNHLFGLSLPTSSSGIFRVYSVTLREWDRMIINFDEKDMLHWQSMHQHFAPVTVHILTLGLAAVPAFDWFWLHEWPRWKGSLHSLQNSSWKIMSKEWIHHWMTVFTKIRVM